MSVIVSFTMSPEPDHPGAIAIRLLRCLSWAIGIYIPARHFASITYGAYIQLAMRSKLDFAAIVVWINGSLTLILWQGLVYIRVVQV